MTDTERIDKLCEYLIDLIDELSNDNLNWIREEILNLLWER